MAMFKTDVTIEQLSREIVDFLSVHIRVSRMILFGSYAYGRPRKDSDFDIAVISPDLAEMNILEKMELFAKAAVAVDSRIELKGFSAEKFLHPEQGSLLEMIKNSGKIIYPAISGQDQKEGVPLTTS
jgi:predicted nucleotidyltransferase